MKKIRLVLLAILWLAAGTTPSILRAQTPSGSDYLVARNIPAKTLFYQYSGTGTLMPKINWGLDEAWCSETNMLQGRNYLNLFKENIDIVRISFQPAWAMSNTTTLSSSHINGVKDNDGNYTIVGLAERIRVLKLLGTTPSIYLNCDPTSLGIASTYKGTSSTYYTRWVNLIRATGKYIENEGFTVTGIAPFNEPDLSSSGYPNAATQSNICKSLKSDTWGKNKITMGGNTLNPDYALSWYSNYKANFDEGNTHQLAGTFANYIGFMQQVKSDGKRLCQDEMHNVMEAMVGANYGMNDAIWWGTSEHARSQFCRANDGTGYRLAYLEDSGTFTAASIYRNTQDGVTEAYLGCSERNATETSYGFVSTDRDVYYDGYGPTRAFYMHLPADPSGTYQGSGQKNAERVINIQSGDDVQPAPTVGDFQIMNVGNGKVIQGNTSLTGWSANQATLATGSGADGQGWRIEAVAEDIVGDFSYYTIHSYNAQYWIYYLDDNEWGFEEANPIIMYPGGGSGCEQWYFVYAGDGSYYIHNRYSNLCLDGSDGATLVQRTRTNSDTQKWKLVAPTCTPDRTAPAQPTGLTATALLAAVKLSWTANAESDLSGYTVLRTVKGANDWNTIARNVTGTTYIDNTVVQGTEYTYKLKAMDLSCNFSTASSTVNGAATAAQGLVARYEFDGSMRDKSTNQMAGALYTASYTDSRKSGSQALSLDGSSNYALLPYQIGNMPALTFCGWVYWNGGNAWQRIFDFGSGEDAYFFLTPSDGSNMKFEIKANGTTQNLTATKLGTSAWKHVAVTIQSGSVKIYVDGSQVASSTSITLSPSNVAGVCNYLGRSQFVSDPLFNGRLDDVRIYNYVLSQSEIQAIASNTSTEAITEWSVGGSYYVYNIEAGQFLNQGNAWGTQASLDTEGLLWTVSSGASTSLYRLNRSGETNYLYAPGVNDLYVDGASNHDFAMVQDAETGLTSISVNPSGSYGTSAYGISYIGWTGEADVTTVIPVLKDTDHSKPGLQWRLMTATEYSTYKTIISNALSARQAMWPLIQSARLTDFDLSSALAIYQDPASTATQINNARATLLTNFREYLTSNASQSNPIDASYFITNPGCGSSTFSGWTAVNDWGSNTAYYRNGDAVLQGRFMEAWVNGWNGETLADRSLTQQLSGLPEGKYQLSLDIIATNQNTREDVTGVNLTLGTATAPCSTTEDNPSTFTPPTFIVGSNGQAAIGLVITSTNASWVAFDNFRLFYLGPIKLGDVDEDGNLDENDVRAIALHLVGLTPDKFNQQAADVNQDGYITLSDITSLVNKLKP